MLTHAHLGGSKAMKRLARADAELRKLAAATADSKARLVKAQQDFAHTHVHKQQQQQLEHQTNSHINNSNSSSSNSKVSKNGAATIAEIPPRRLTTTVTTVDASKNGHDSKAHMQQQQQQIKRINSDPNLHTSRLSAVSETHTTAAAATSDTADTRSNANTPTAANRGSTMDNHANSVQTHVSSDAELCARESALNDRMQHIISELTTLQQQLADVHRQRQQQQQQQQQ